MPRSSLSPSSFLSLLLLALGRPAPPPSTCATAEDFLVRTDDGATLALHHHLPLEVGAPPVLVVHGISSNHACWDLEPGRSFADHLVEAGFDPWLLDLRGHGAVRRPPDGDAPRSGWSIDDYALHDLPTALSFVTERTGATRLGYVGHSLGGMVGAIHAIRLGEERLAALVAVGSPVDFGHPDRLLQIMEHTFSLGGRILPSIQTPALASLLDRVPGGLPRDLESLLYNPENMEAGAARRMMNRVVSPLWAGEMMHFSRMLDEGRFASSDGKLDYFASLDRIQVPTLVIAGRADRVAPPDRVRPYAERVGSATARYVLAGRENGFDADYGHLDLCVGDHAWREIHPLISTWMREEAGLR